MQRQSGNIHITSDLVTWVVGLAMTVGGGTIGGATVYFSLKQEVAVMNTKLEYIQRDVGEIKADLKERDR